MTIAVVVYPGTNCELDIAYALNRCGAETEFVWHTDTDLGGATGVVLPGGFAHGDYLRTGAIARFSPIMDEVTRLAGLGVPTLGICNGFQILCEAGLLEGGLVANRDLKFICRPINVVVESTESILTMAAEVGQVLTIPLNSYEGNYVSGDIERLEASGRIVLRYASLNGAITERANANGSTNNIAAIAGAGGNVVGLMPHPERASEEILGSADGIVLLEGFVASTELVTA